VQSQQVVTPWQGLIVPHLHVPPLQVFSFVQITPVQGSAGGVEMPLQLTVFPYTAVSMGGVTEFISIAISAPVSAAVAHTFALARVSAPIIWPEA